MQSDFTIKMQKWEGKSVFSCKLIITVWCHIYAKGFEYSNFSKAGIDKILFFPKIAKISNIYFKKFLNLLSTIENRPIIASTLKNLGQGHVKESTSSLLPVVSHIDVLLP